MRRFITIGAGPAGLTAALELLRRTDIQPVVLEASDEIGGLSRTVRYKGNCMDIGGHRFFSKSDRVMQWWMDLMPPDLCATDVAPCPRGKERDPAVPAQDADAVMLVRPRKSRIYYLRRFFDYPIQLTGNTVRNLGPRRIVRIAMSYVACRTRPVLPEKSLQDFLINRFGKELYRTFFESYTEKVWGMPCDRISAEWGPQRIKGLSLAAALKHFVRRSVFCQPASAGNLAQKGTDTSLIERFLYPKFGPGQLWELVADRVVQMGGKLHKNSLVDTVLTEGNRVIAVETVAPDGTRERYEGDYFLSTMPMRELVHALRRGGAAVPANVLEVSDGLQYRDFITVGVLADRLAVQEPDGGLLRDTWIYIQEPDVLLGRLQVFNNWSPFLLTDPAKVWLGLEYFCSSTDPLWCMPDDELKRFAAAELEKIGILNTAEVIDSHAVRVPGAYPAYFGNYNRFDELREWIDGFDNLFLAGRNGMHKYNNQDHSMLTAMAVVDGIAEHGRVDKRALWNINTESEYHEENNRKA